MRNKTRAILDKFTNDSNNLKMQNEFTRLSQQEAKIAKNPNSTEEEKLDAMIKTDEYRDYCIKNGLSDRDLKY